MQKTPARKYSPATTRMTASGPATLTTSGPSNAKPMANAALRVSVKMPFAVSNWLRGTRVGIIANSAGAKKTVTVETKMLSSRMTAKLSPASQSAMNAAPRRKFVAIRIEPAVDAIDVDARDSREEDGRHEEGQDQQADRRVRAGRLDDDDGQAEQDHVAADLGRHLRQPETEEGGVPEDRERVGFLGRLGGRDGLRHVDEPSGPGGTGPESRSPLSSPGRRARRTRPAGLRGRGARAGRGGRRSGSGDRCRPPGDR